MTGRLVVVGNAVLAGLPETKHILDFSLPARRLRWREFLAVKETVRRKKQYGSGIHKGESGQDSLQGMSME